MKSSYIREDIIGASITKECATCKHAYFYWDGDTGVCFEYHSGNIDTKGSPYFWYIESNGCDNWKPRIWEGLLEEIMRKDRELIFRKTEVQIKSDYVLRSCEGCADFPCNNPDPHWGNDCDPHPGCFNKKNTCGECKHPWRKENDDGISYLLLCKEFPNKKQYWIERCNSAEACSNFQKRKSL